jgi:hypothetical protein
LQLLAPPAAKKWCFCNPCFIKIHVTP